MKVKHLNHVFFQEQIHPSNVARNYVYKQVLASALKRKNVMLSDANLSFQGNVQHLKLDVFYRNKQIRRIKYKLKRKFSNRKFLRYLYKKKTYRRSKKFKKYKNKRYRSRKVVRYQRKMFYVVPLEDFVKGRQKIKDSKFGKFKIRKYIPKRLKRTIFKLRRIQIRLSKFKFKLRKRLKKKSIKKYVKKLSKIRSFEKSIIGKIRLLQGQKLFFLTKLEKNSLFDLHLRVNPLNKYLKSKVVFFNLMKSLSKYRFSLFQRGNTLMNDFFAVSSLLNRKKLSVDVFTTILSSVFKNLHKRKHFIFFGFVRRLAKIFVKVPTSFVRGMKVEISGRLGGRNKAKTQRVIAGRLSTTTVSVDTKFCKQDIHTIYGTYGIKVWVTYGNKKLYSKKFKIKGATGSRFQKNVEKRLYQLRKVKKKRFNKLFFQSYKQEVNIQRLLFRVSKGGSPLLTPRFIVSQQRYLRNRGKKRNFKKNWKK